MCGEKGGARAQDAGVGVCQACGPGLHPTPLALPATRTRVLCSRAEALLEIMQAAGGVEEAISKHRDLVDEGMLRVGGICSAVW